MHKSHQNILESLRRNIIADMDVYNGIIQPLKSDYILNDEHIEKIQTGCSKQERAGILLDILPRYKF